MPTNTGPGSCTVPCFINCWVAAAKLPSAWLPLQEQAAESGRYPDRLCASVIDWAQYRRTKGAVKLHLLLDHQGLLPSFALVTEGRVHESRIARTLRFDPGAIVVFDRGYTDYAWFSALDADGVYFVTRMKDNADYGIVERRPVPERGPSSAMRSCFYTNWPAAASAICSCAVSRSGTKRSNASWCFSPIIAAFPYSLSPRSTVNAGRSNCSSKR